MLWELLIALILAVGVYLTIEESREKRRAREKQIRETVAEQHLGETAVEGECTENRFSEPIVNDEKLEKEE